uniref:Uncharacterized protein n=1 Tax=viral metagenome TaxID=1070528 RepID=A0A6C0J3G4_9ZZZZ
MIKDTRKLKQLGNEVKPGELFLHPTLLTLQINDDKKSIIPSELNIKDNKIYLNYGGKIKSEFKNLSKQELQSITSIPEIIYNDVYILYLYQINNLENLQNFIDNEIKKKTRYTTVNRVINIYLINKYNNFKNNYSSLINIYFKICKNYWTKINIEDSRLKDYIEAFLNSFFRTTNYNDFHLDCGTSLKSYLKNKIKI